MSFFLRKTGIVMATSLVCFSQSGWACTSTCGPCGCQNQWVTNPSDAQNCNMASVCYNACSEFPYNQCSGYGQGTLSDGWNSIQRVSSNPSTACILYIGQNISLTSASNLNQMSLGSGSNLVIASFVNSSSSGNTSPNPNAVVVNGSGYTGYAIYIGGGSGLYLGSAATDQIGYQGCTFSSNVSSIIFRGTMASWGSSTNSQTANTWQLGATPTLSFNNGAVAGYNDNFQMYSSITISATGTVNLGGVISQPVSSVSPTFNGTFNLSGANTFYSGCVVNNIVNNVGYTLTVSGSSPLGMPAVGSTTTLNIGTLQMSSANLSIPIILNSASSSTVPIIDLIGTNTLSGTITFGAGTGLNITSTSISTPSPSLTFTGSLSPSTALITVASGATLSTPGITVSNLNVQSGGIYNVTQNQTVVALGVASTSTTDSTGSIVLSNSTALTISGTTNNTFGGVISSASLATGTSVNITGSQTFSGANTFIGNWVVSSGGTLTMGSASTLGTQTIVLNSGGTLNGPSAGATILNTLNLPSSGTVTMSNLTLSGPITIPSGVSSGVAISGTVTLTPSVLTIATGSLFQTSGQNITVVTFGSGSGTLGMGSSGTDTLTILATSPTTFSGVIANNGTNSIGAVLIGSAGVSAGSSIVTLSGNNTFTGGLTLTSGILSISAATQLGSGSIIGNGGTLANSTSSTITITNPWTFNVQGAGTTTTTFGGSSLTGPLLLNGAFTVGFGSGVTSGTVSLAKASGTTLTLTPSSLTIPSGATFATNGNNITVGSGGLIGSGTISLGASSKTDTLTITSNSTFAGNIVDAGTTSSGAIGAVVIGNSGASFSGNNTFSGGLTLSSTGTINCILSIAAANSVGTGPVIMNAASGVNCNLFATTSGVILTNPFVLSGINVFSVDFITTPSISGSGTFQLQGCPVSGVSTLGTLTITGPSTYSGSIVNGTYTYAGSLTGPAAVVIQAGSTGGNNNIVTFNGSTASTFTGGLTLYSGTLAISNVGNLGSATPAIIANGGTLANSTSSLITITNPWTFNVQSAGTTTTTFGGSSLTGPFTLTGAFTVNLNTYTSGTVSLAKASGTTLTLTPSSLTIPSGATFATNGNNITVGSGGLIGSGTISLGASSKTDTLTITGNSTFAGNIVDAGTTSSGAIGAVVATGANPLTLTGANTFSGGLTLNASNTAIYFSAANNVGTGPITMIGPSNLIAQASGVNLTNSFVLSGANVFTADFITTSSISGSGSIALQGYNGSLGTLTITGTSTYSGSIGNGSYPTPLGIAAVVIQAGSTGGNNNIVTFNGSTASTFTGGLTLYSGTLAISNVGNLGSATPAIIANGGTLANSTSSLITITNPWTFNVQSAGTTTTTFGGSSLTGPFTLTGAFTVGFGSGVTSGTVSLAKASGTTLTLTPSSLTIPTGATFATNGNNMTVGSGGLSGSGTISLGAAGSTPLTDTLTIQGTTSFSGIISNNGSGLGAVTIAAGSGNTVTLSGANTFTGGLTLTTGTLSISSNTNAGNMASNNPNSITFAGGTISSSVASPAIAFTYNPMTFTGGSTATFAGIGSFTVSGPFTVTGTGTATITNTSASLTLAPTSVTMSGGSTLAISGANNSFPVAGSLTITGTSGTATIASGGGLVLSPSSLTIATGTTFSTNNTNISVQSFPNSSSTTNTNTGTLSLGTGTLTISASSVGGSSSFYGVVQGSGGVVVQGQVGFFGANTFTGGVTLSPAASGSSALTIQAASGLGTTNGTTTGIVTGNGGTLTTSGTTTSITLVNPWVFTAGATAVTTTLNVGANQILALSGAISTALPSSATSGTAVIATAGSGTVQFGTAGTPLTSLTIPTNTTLQINGNSATSSNVYTSNLSGGGNLALGGQQGGAITGTLFIMGPNSSPFFSGTISDNPSGGNAAVTINAGSVGGVNNVVTFSGTAASTFTGGLTLQSGTLSITAATTGSTTKGTVTFSGGELLNAGSGSTSKITLGNSVIFTGGSTAIFSGYFDLTGSLSINGTTGTTAKVSSLTSGGLTLNLTSLNITTNVSFQTLGQMAGNSLIIGAFGSGSGTLYLGPTSGSTPDTLTISATPSTSFAGIIADALSPNTGKGAVIVNAPVTFTGPNTFSGGLTLSSNSLTIQAASGVGASTNPITGNGGGLTTVNANPGVPSTITLSNPWTCNVGTTTTLSVGSSSTLALTGSITAAAGSSTVVISSGQSNGILNLNPSSLTINSASLQIVGNNAANSSISTASILGAGNLILGGASTSTVGTLTLTGTLSSYTGSIIDNTTGGKGAVAINAGSGTVTFTKANTFSGGLTLTSGTLSMSAVNQLGGSTNTPGTIYGNGGTLAITATATILNPVILSVGTTTTFNAAATTILTLNGPLSIPSVTAGTATIAKAGTGTVIINPTSLTVPTGTTLATNGNSIQLGSGSLQGSFGAGNGTISLGPISGSGTDTLTIASSSKSAITFGGSIVDEGSGGTGAVVIQAAVTFTGQNTFSGGLTLGLPAGGSSGVTSILTITPTSTNPNPIGTGNLIGSGGALLTTVSFTVTNPLQLTGGIVGSTGNIIPTTFTTSSSNATLAFTGALSTVGTGAAGISTSGTSGIVTFGTAATPLPSITILSGTSLQTNGVGVYNSSTNSGGIITATIAGSGSLVLGGSNKAIDTLIISGTTASSYSGAIVNTTANNGSGAVIIQAPVTFTGNNTFSGGLTLSSSTLTITSANSGASNIGAVTGLLTFSGGGLVNTNSGAGSLITISNPVVFTGGSTAAFTNYFSLQGTLSVVVSGSGSGIAKVSGTSGNTTLLSPTSLTINNSTTLQTNGNSIALGNTVTAGTFGSGSGTLSLGPTTGSGIDTLTINSPSSGVGTSTTFSGIIADASSNGKGAVVINASTSTITFTGANTFSGGLTLTAGTLTFGTSAGISNVGTGTITGSGGTLTTTNSSISLANPLTLTSGTTTTMTVGTITTSGSLGSGNLALGGFSSGSGSSQVVTPGMLIINGATTYGGIISNGNSNNGAVTITAGSGNAVTFSNTAATKSSQWFSGGLTLTSGTLTISNAFNAGSGTITGKGGTLISTSGSVTLTNNLVLSSDTTTFVVSNLSPSSISGSGGLALEGVGGSVGTLTIGSACTYAGFISDATYASGGSAAVVINAGATTGTNNIVTFSGTTASTFTGGLTLDSGTLLISNTGNLGSSGTPIIGAGGTLAISSGSSNSISNSWTLSSTTTVEVDNTNTAMTLSGVISGNGGLTKTGSGVLALTGLNTYTGTTTVSGGTLNINAVGSSAAGVNITVSSGVVNVNTNISPTTSSNTQTNITINSGGNLTIGALSSATLLSSSISPQGTSASKLNTTVSSGGSLTVGGTGSIGATLYSDAYPGNVTNSGIINGVGIIYGTVNNKSSGTNSCAVKPGNSIGTLTIVGDISFDPTTSYIVEFSTVASSKLIVLGDMSIGSGANVLLFPHKGLYIGTATHQIADVLGGFTGTFTHVLTVPGVFLDTVISYENNRLILATITPLSINGGSGGGLAKGSNAIAVASAIDNVITYNRANVEWSFVSGQGFVFDVPPQIPLVIESLLPFINSSEEMTYALNQMHPALFKGMTIVQQNNAVEVREALSNRMQNKLDSEHCFIVGKDADDKSPLAKSCHKEKKSVQVWANGLGNVLDQDSNTIHSNPEIGYQSKMAGAVLGIDKRFAEHYYVGALGGYTSSHIHFKQGKGTGDVNSGYAGIYASALGKMFYGNISATVGWNEFSAKRNIVYPGVNLTAKNDHLGTQLLSHLDTGVNIGFKGITLRPFDSFDYVAQREKAYTETEAGEWNLHVNKTNAILIRNELGLQLAGCLCFKSSKWTVAPKLSWVREVRVKGKSSVAQFVGTDAPFEVVGYYPDRSLLSPGVAVSGLMLNDRLTLGAYYNGEFKGGYSSHNYGGEVRFGF